MIDNLIAKVLVTVISSFSMGMAYRYKNVHWIVFELWMINLLLWIWLL